MTDQYWSTAAQVIPALGIALVIESRYIANSLTVSFPRSALMLANFSIATLLALLGFAEIVAFSALRAGQSSPLQDGIIGTAIEAGTAALILSPAVTFILQAGFQAVRMGRTFGAVCKELFSGLRFLDIWRRRWEFKRLRRTGMQMTKSRIRWAIIRDKLDRSAEELGEGTPSEDRELAKKEVLESVRRQMNLTERDIERVLADMEQIREDHVRLRHPEILEAGPVSTDVVDNDSEGEANNSNE